MPDTDTGPSAQLSPAQRRRKAEMETEKAADERILRVILICLVLWYYKQLRSNLPEFLTKERRLQSIIALTLAVNADAVGVIPSVQVFCVAAPVSACLVIPVMGGFGLLAALSLGMLSFPTFFRYYPFVVSLLVTERCAFAHAVYRRSLNTWGRYVFPWVVRGASLYILLFEGDKKWPMSVPWLSSYLVLEIVPRVSGAM